MTPIADTKLSERLLKAKLLAIGQEAKAAARVLALSRGEQKDRALHAGRSNIFVSGMACVLRTGRLGPGSRRLRGTPSRLRRSPVL